MDSNSAATSTQRASRNCSSELAHRTLFAAFEFTVNP